MSDPYSLPTFFEWYAERSRRPDDPPLTPEEETEWIRGFVTVTAWQGYRTGQAIHDGDCINMPYSCGFCGLENLLIEYREYVGERLGMAV